MKKWLFKKSVNELHYTGGDAAFLDEAIKYLVINIYDKNKRDNAGRVAIILTASANPRSVRGLTKMLRKKDITTLTVAMGPGVNMQQINDITNVSPHNRAYVLGSTGELSDQLLGLTDYLCTLGLDPEVPKPALPVSPLDKEPPRITTTTLSPGLEPNPTSPTALSPTTTPSGFPTKEVAFIIEGSEYVGEVNFNKTLAFLEQVISQLTENEQVIRITVIQYSTTVTVEISRWELRRQRALLLQRLREIRWMGGSQINTGAAVKTFQEMSTSQHSGGPTPPQLAFLITENPPTDIVTRPPSTSTQTYIYPIGVGPKVQEVDLFPFSSPHRPLIVVDYNHLSKLVSKVVNITCATVTIRSPTLPPLVVPTLSSLPSSGDKQSFQSFSHSVCIYSGILCTVPCKKPMDIMFLLKAGEQLEDMKTFVKAFINSADIGVCVFLQTIRLFLASSTFLHEYYPLMIFPGTNGTQVSVVQYGATNSQEVTWKDEQGKPNLLNLVERIPRRTAAAPALGIGHASKRITTMYRAVCAITHAA